MLVFSLYIGKLTLKQFTRTDSLEIDIPKQKGK